MKNHVIKLGVDGDKILLDNKASTIHENALFTKDIVEDHKFKSIIVVISEFHSRRYKAAIEKAFENTLIDDKKVDVKVTYSQ